MTARGAPSSSSTVADVGAPRQIDVKGASPQPGTPLIAYPQKTSGTDNQLWQLWQFVAVMA